MKLLRLPSGEYQRRGVSLGAHRRCITATDCYGDEINHREWVPGYDPYAAVNAACKRVGIATEIRNGRGRPAKRKA